MPVASRVLLGRLRPRNDEPQQARPHSPFPLQSRQDAQRLGGGDPAGSGMLSSLLRHLLYYRDAATGLTMIWINVASIE
jgi:hypothetical protein